MDNNPVSEDQSLDINKIWQTIWYRKIWFFIVFVLVISFTFDNIIFLSQIGLTDIKLYNKARSFCLKSKKNVIAEIVIPSGKNINKFSFNMADDFVNQSDSV